MWAVGSSGSVDGLTLTERALALHWDGRRWQTVPLPRGAMPPPADPGEPKPPVVIDSEGFPQGVAARSRSDAWIVGSTGGDPSSPLAWHWNGVRWRLVGAPGPPQLRGLEAVTIVSRDDVWATGPGDDRVVHWDGRRWHVPPQPKPQRDTEVNALASGRTGAVWVGAPLQRWNGRGWIMSRSAGRDEMIQSIAAVTASDVWAVGYVWHTGAGMPRPLALRRSCAR